MTTVWDFDPDLGTPPHGPVDGKVDEPEGRGLDLGVFADLAVHLGGLASSLRREQDRRDQEARSIPADYQVAQAGLYPASGSLLLNLGSPDIGESWQVRRLIIGGADITSTPAGIGWVLVQGSPPNANGANPPISQVADFTSGTLPQKAFYGTHEFYVDATEYVYVVITGGTAGVQYTASLKAEVFELAVKVQRFVE